MNAQPLTEADREELGARTGRVFVDHPFRSGSAHLNLAGLASEGHDFIDRSALLRPSKSRGLLWHYMVQLGPENGLLNAASVLLNEEFGALASRPPEELEADLARHLGSEEWARLKAEALEYHQLPSDREAWWRHVLIALWAEHLSEPLSVEWLAAMARHAYAYDSFAAGYLLALLDQRLTNDEAVERGAKVRESAASGGRTRATDAKARRVTILSAMARLVGNGHSVSRAAELAHEAGHGTSAEANRRLWVRHRGQGGRGHGDGSD